MKTKIICLVGICLVGFLAVSCGGFKVPQISLSDLGGATATMTATSTMVPTYTPTLTSTSTPMPTATSTPAPPTATLIIVPPPIATATKITNAGLPTTGYLDLEDSVFEEWWEYLCDIVRWLLNLEE